MQAERTGFGGKHKLLPYLAEWAKMTEFFYEKTGESSFVYREETNVSMLCAAVWRKGEVAISEFQYEGAKKTDAGRNNRIVDLSIWHKQVEYFIEAKQVWPIFSSADKYPKKAEVDSACKIFKQIEDLNMKQSYKEKECCGIIFIAPNVQVEKANKNPDLLLPDTALKYLEKLSPKAFAWSFPATKNKKTSVNRGGSKEKPWEYYRPGVLAALFTYSQLKTICENERF